MKKQINSYYKKEFCSPIRFLSNCNKNLLHFERNLDRGTKLFLTEAVDFSFAWLFFLFRILNPIKLIGNVCNTTFHDDYKIAIVN